MGIGTIEEKVNPWEYMCLRWNQFAPPGRPSENDIKVMKDILYQGLLNHPTENQSNQFRVLVLGATPEIRDMLAEDNRITVTLVDITTDMIISMGQLMEHSTDREIWVKSNWFDVPLETGYYDAVLSDLVICNVEYRNHDKFYSKIASLMKPDGHWINRVYAIDGNTVIRSLDDLLAEYSRKEQLSKEDINNFRSTAGLIAWLPEEKLLDWSILYDEMKKYQQKGAEEGRFYHENPIYADILERTYDLFKPFDKKYYLDTEERTEEKMRQYFCIGQKVPDANVIDLREKAYYIYDLVKHKKAEQDGRTQ